MSEESALDWLCFNLDASSLPGSMAGNVSSRAAGHKIEVLGRHRPGQTPRSVGFPPQQEHSPRNFSKRRKIFVWGKPPISFSLAFFLPNRDFDRS